MFMQPHGLPHINGRYCTDHSLCFPAPSNWTARSRVSAGGKEVELRLDTEIRTRVTGLGAAFMVSDSLDPGIAQ